MKLAGLCIDFRVYSCLRIKIKIYLGTIKCYVCANIWYDPRPIWNEFVFLSVGHNICLNSIMNVCALKDLPFHFCFYFALISILNNIFINVVFLKLKIKNKLIIVSRPRKKYSKKTVKIFFSIKYICTKLQRI